MIAALFVAEGGGYFSDPRFDPWGETRDARKYVGSDAVVAHPPCQLWTNFAALNFKRYGGEHNRPGNDGGCFASALASIRRCGGVLEHPAFSNAWRAHGLTAPDGIGWTQAGECEWTCEVWQSTYGHKARKRTWLYFVGTTRPPELDWRREPGTHQIGWFDRLKPTLSKHEALSTPASFRDALHSLAACSRAGLESY